MTTVRRPDLRCSVPLLFVCTLASCGGSYSGNAGQPDGASSSTASHAGSNVTDDAEASSDDASGAASMGAEAGDAQGLRSGDGPDGALTADDAAVAIDAAFALDAAGGDGGAAPYKGVANSACGDFGRLRVTWFYNWTLDPHGCHAAPFVPMIWGHTGNESMATGIASELDGLVAGGYRTVLGFNEPDNTSQSNMPVGTAISLWPSLTSAPSIRVGSPATSANSGGQAWLTDFMKQVNADATGRLRVDFIAAHWYGWNAGSCDAKASGLESYVQWLEAIPGNRPIWLTESGCLNASNPTLATVQAFFTGAVAMFARHPRLERYAWYPWTMNNELVATDGSLTAVGAAFAAAPALR